MKSPLAAMLAMTAIMGVGNDVRELDHSPIFIRGKSSRERTFRRVPSGRKLYSVESNTNPVQIAACALRRKNGISKRSWRHANRTDYQPKFQMALTSLETRCGLFNHSFNGARKP